MTRGISIGYIATAVLASGLLLTAPTASAAPGVESYGYIGGGIGYYRVEDEEFPNDTDDFEDEREAYRGFIGAMVNRYLGIEAGYTDFAEASDNGVDADADGFTVAAIGQIPLADALSLYGKGGMLAWDIDFDSPIGSRSDDGEDPFYGVGMRIGRAGPLGLRLEYERFELDETDVDLASANLELRF